MLNHGAFNEGKAAAILGQEMRANPYRKFIASLSVPYEGPCWEYAADWDSGHIAGTALHEEVNYG